MQIKPQASSRSGYALLITLVIMAFMLALLASVTQLTSTEARLTARNNLYNSSVAAAEGASEMAISQINRDFVYQSVNPNLDAYRMLTPSLNQSNWPIQFEFSNGKGDTSETGVENLGPGVVTNLNSEFAGLYGLVVPYRITSTARAVNRSFNVAATVSQDIQLASIPVFQFAIFYTLDLELNPGPVMTINGKVHSNGDIYTAPRNGLTYQDSVTSVGRIYNHRHPNDPDQSSGVKPVYQKQHTEKVSALTLPVGTDNDSSTVRQILEPPPVGEDPNSPTGKERYYNKADLIVTTTSSGVTVSAGAWNLFSAIQPDVTNSGVASYSFLKTDTKFKDFREKETFVQATEIDVAAFNAWLKNAKKGGDINSRATAELGHGINSIYVNDQRSTPSRLTGVRVVNGSKLPDSGLTVATKSPLYVKGNFNLNNGDTTVGQTDTSKTKPASLVGDAITVLSGNWDDSNAGQALNKRQAANTTVNAALLGGIVKTTKHGNNKYYSGGAENFIRFLEDWGGKSLTYNGSMVVMFESQIATNNWQNTGNYYEAPTRRWAFDVNFLDQSKLPPGTPQLRKLVRGQWSILSSE